jgi:hypothetical protein
MKAQVVSSNHTIIIDGFQIDIWYNFDQSLLEIFVDGTLKVSGILSPVHRSFNYINLIEVATTILQAHKQKLRQLEIEAMQDLQPIEFE